MQCRRLAEAPATRSATRHRRDRRLQNTAALHFDVALFRDEIRARPLKKMRRLAALIIGVATAQPVQNYYGNADPHLERRRLAKRVPGSSTAAITEQLLCAAADTVVMCTSPMSCTCGQGVVRFRDDRGRFLTGRRTSRRCAAATTTTVLMMRTGSTPRRRETCSRATASPRRPRGARSASARRRPGGLGRRLQKDVRSYP